MRRRVACTSNAQRASTDVVVIHTHDYVLSKPCALDDTRSYMVASRLWLVGLDLAQTLPLQIRHREAAGLNARPNVIAEPCGMLVGMVYKVLCAP
jgi:hypothetical protein